MRSLYLHIPFCLSKCPYCSFSSFQRKESIYDRYYRALIVDIQSSYPEYYSKPINTLFIGGGTPSVLKATQIGEIIDTCSEVYGFSGGAEISMEVNPGTVNAYSLGELRSRGVNRLSIGVQSFDPEELRVLGRIYTPEDIFKVIEEARTAGFENISLDLMYGLPGQSVECWKSNLECGLELYPEHLSLYQLTIEEGTPFSEKLEYGVITLPDEEIILMMDKLTIDLCTSAGFDHYEISNFCRAGYECSHNMVYWRNESYMACGAGAVRYITGTRSRIVSDPSKYCLLVEEGADTTQESEKLGLEASFRESVVMGLRLTKGFREARLRERFGCGLREIYGTIVDDLISRNMLETDSDYIRLSIRGRQLANMVMAELV